MSDINDSFGEEEKLVLYQESGMRLCFEQSSLSSQINTLGELLTEWYLFDSSTKKDLDSFLISEGVADIISPNQFMDVMCGMACISDTCAQMVYKKLPFQVSMDRIYRMNDIVARTRPCIQTDDEKILKKISEMWHENRVAHADKMREYQCKYREQNQQVLRKYKQQYYIQNKERFREYKQKYYVENKARINQKNRDYYHQHKEEISAQRRLNTEQTKEYNKKYYEQNRERLIEYKRKYYAQHREQMCEQGRQYKEKNREKLRAYSHQQYKQQRAKKLEYRQKYYEQNHEQAKNSAMQSQRRKLATEKIAANVCPAFIFASWLKKENLALYLNFYTRYQCILDKYARKCPAVVGADFTKCQLYNCATMTDDEMKQSCPAHKVFRIPDAVPAIRQWVSKKQHQK